MKKTFRLAISGLAVAGFAFAGLAGPVSAKVHRPAAHPKGTVAFLGPEQFTGRWPKDAKYFKQKLHSLDKRLKILEYNANANINLQTQQFNTALAKGAKVIVLAAVDQNEDAPLVNKAESQGVKVIAYDRMIQSPKLRAYVSFNNVTVGKEQGGWFASHVKKGATIVEIRGSSTDHNAALFYRGFCKEVCPKIKKHVYKLGYAKWTPNWDPPTAGQEMDAALAKLHNKVGAVYSMNDAMAAAVSAALKRVGLEHIPLTGQDAQADGLGRILVHQQGMTVYKPIYDEAYTAARVAYRWIAGKGLPSYFHTNCGVACSQASGREVPSALYTPIEITRKNVAKPVNDGFDSWADVCASIGKHTSKPYCGLKK